MEKLLQKTLQQPKPESPRRPYASFLEDYVNPAIPGQLSESVNTFVSQWLESIGSDGEKRCRSDSHLHSSDDGPISRKLTRSAPGMACTRDSDGYLVPPTPSSQAISAGPSQLISVPTGSSVRSRCLVEDPFYRDMNLTANSIYSISGQPNPGTCCQCC